jgi:protein ImuB
LSLWLERLSTDRCAGERSERPAQPLNECARRTLARSGLVGARIARQSPEVVSPLAVYGKRGNLDLLTAVDAAAERLGLYGGLALAQARAMHPALTAVPEDQAADACLLDVIADWCQRYTPLVAIDPPDGILLDIGGCTHLFGGEARLREDLLARVARFGFSARAALASEASGQRGHSISARAGHSPEMGLSARAAVAATIGTAWATARFSEVPVTARGSECDCLAPLPLAALRLSPDMVAALARVGLKRIGDILDLPRAPLTARFGIDLLRQLDRALGREDEPLNPLRPVAPYVAERSFPEPIAREEDVLATVERLAARLKPALVARGDGARRLELALFRTDGLVKRIAAGTSRPVRDPQAIRALFVERLAALGDELDPGFGFDLARLSVVVAEPRADEQIGLGNREDQAELDRLVDRLSARLGRRRVSRLVAHDSHIPELASSSVPAQTPPPYPPPHSASKTRVNALMLGEGKGGGGWDAFRRFQADAGLSPRPLRLLAKPEPLDDVFALVPDGPPVRFRWRRALHEVVAAEGPERIEDAWWTEDDELTEWPRSQRPRAARDYFRIEDKTGLRFWLFRSGLYRDMARGLPTPRWFLHGMYA